MFRNNTVKERLLNSSETLLKKIANCNRNISNGAYAAIGGAVIIAALIATGIVTGGAVPLAFLVFSSIVGGSMVLGGGGWSIYNNEKVKQYEEEKENFVNRPAKIIKPAPKRNSVPNQLRDLEEQKAKKSYKFDLFSCFRSRKDTNIKPEIVVTKVRNSYGNK